MAGMVVSSVCQALYNELLLSETVLFSLQSTKHSWSSTLVKHSWSSTVGQAQLAKHSMQIWASKVGKAKLGEQIWAAKVGQVEMVMFRRHVHLGNLS